MIEKILAIITVIWFYHTAKQVGENPIKWCITGLIGFFLVVLIAHFAIAEPILETFNNPSKTIRFLFGNIPGVTGFIVAFIIRRNYLPSKSEINE